MEEELDLHLKSLSDDVDDLPVSADPRTTADRRTRHLSQFPLQLDSGEIIHSDRRHYNDRRSRTFDVNAVKEAEIQDLERLEKELGIS